ncbi:hypothetical protein CNR27_07880 [Luteimonas chenhongjianii]|uniref:Uncharacterized protein n=1 Tax=Luteimonas chenhongjianii TaxID=2006110 RepID=A0A290XE62_9GAMM|nr:leukotoxin LktA family filamentous adhesin [Luteimonas chenhongjianii]ATD67361.1 hypothetical protein CNR27_07880 [Luteimonas chenhongjianii]
MNRRDPSSRLPSSMLVAPGGRRLRVAGLSMAIGSALGLTLSGQVAAGDAGSSITTDGRTGTTVNRVGADPHWQVNTTTVKGRHGQEVAFNSFRQFGIEAGQTVDLVLPTHNQEQVRNLVNLVNDARAYINGNLNSVLEASGEVGGKVFFVAPDGLLVGSTGVLNVGSLSVATANRSTMDDILGAGDSLDGLMYGTLKPEQLTRSGTVQLDGTVNAQNGIRVQARAVDVTGTLFVAAGPRTAADDLLTVDAAVNTGAGQALALVNDGGRIQLRAAAISDTGLGVRSAEATVTVRGNAQLTADDIELTANAVIDSGYDKDGAVFDELKADLVNSVTDSANLVDLGDALVNLGADKILGEQISFLHGTTTARVEVKDAATLDARNDVTLHASTRQRIDNSAAGKAYEDGEFVRDADGKPMLDADGNAIPKQHKLSLGAAYAQIDATSEAVVRSGATVRAGGAVAVKADADTTLKLAAESFAVNNTTAAFTAAISNVNVDTRAVIEAGSAPLQAGSVNVSAVNTTSLDTSAIARTDQNGAVGLAAAISLQDIQAQAQLDRDTVTRSGDVTVQAANVTTRNRTSTLIAAPESDPAPGQEQVEAISRGSDGLMGAAQSLVGAGIGSALSKLGQSDDATPPPPTQPTKAAPFRLGGAISVVHGDHAASAGIGALTTVDSAGAIVVDSQVIDAQIGNHAMSNVLAKGKGADGSAFSLSGAVNIANLTHEAQTLVGSAAELTAQRIGLSSDVRLPRDFSALTGAVPDFSSFDAFKTSISAAKDLVTDPSDLFASYAAARGSAEEVGIGGAVSWFKASNRARTDVASGASLATRDTSGAAWTAVLDGVDHAGDLRSRSFDAAAALRATTDVTALHAAGDLALKNLKDSNVGKGGAALGGSVGYIDYENTAAAIINDSVTVETGAGALQVEAINRETVVALALQSGQGGSIGVSGTATALDLDSTTLAGISNRADIRAGNVGIRAEEDLFVWSVAGAVAMSDSVSVGASVAYQQMDTDTRAFVGLVPDEFATGDRSAAGGAITTGALAVNATSVGLAGAVAAAGAVAKSSSEQLQQQQAALAQQQNAENPGFLDSLKTRALGKVNALEDMASKADSSGTAGLTEYFDKAKGMLGSGSGDAGQGAQTPQPKFGIAVSGSATVNRSRQNTRADIDSAVIRDGSGDGVELDIAALNRSLLVSVSGALSVAAAGSDNNQGSASLAGGVAYGDIRNTTIAELRGSHVEDAGDVRVSARNESEQVNVGLSVGVNASSDQSTAGAGAISATVAMSKNATRAGIHGGSLTGLAGAGGDVDVTAVNESKIANGGGALYFGGKAGLGAAVTYAEVGDDTRATISGTHIDAVEDVRVRAADASRIVAAAASGGASTRNDGVAIAGSVLVNRIANQTVASIDGGTVIDAAGDVEAFAGTARIEDVRAQGDGCDSRFSVDYCGTSVGAIEVDANADTASSEDTGVDAAGRNDARSSIIAVAGMVQVGGNNAGVAFAYNTIENAHVVSVNDAAINARRIALTAADSADILAVSAGIGGSTGNFTGVGSASYNAIGNTTAVLVGRSLVDAQGFAPRAGAQLTADSIRLDATDSAFIGSLAGAATLGSKVAVGAALTINDIGNTTLALVDAADVDAGAGAVRVAASNTAEILSGAVAAGAAGNVAVQGSVGWGNIYNHAEAALSGGTLTAGSLGVDAGNDSKIHTLAGAVAGGGTAAIGAAINVVSIGDQTLADVDGTALDISGALDVTAASAATTKTLAIAGAFAGTASIAASNTTNLLDTTTQARLHDVRGHGDGITGPVTVRAETTGKNYSLGGALSGGGTVGVGAASSVNDIGGRTTALVENAALGNATTLTIDASNRSLVRTAAVSGAGAGTAAVSGSVTTNRISSDTFAHLADSTLANEQADVVVRARDARDIDSLAGAGAVAGSVGVGAAVAYNDIGGSTAAVVGGNALELDVRNLLLQADAAGAAGSPGNRIRTVAAGLGGGGAVGGAASVAVNRMQGTVSARIEDGAAILASDNIGVLAAQAQQIDVYAGSIGAGVTAGIGLGTVVNLVDGVTEASITGARTRVTALGLGDALRGVDSGVRGSPNTHSNRQDATNLSFDAVDLSTGRVDVHGLAVNASTRQRVNTLGVSAAIGTTPIASGAVSVMAAVNDIAGRTSATIEDAQINQHGLGGQVDPDGESDSLAAAGQSVDLRASHHVASANYVMGIAASPGVFSGAGALSTNRFDSRASAGIVGAKVRAADAVTVQAQSSQNALALVAGAAAGLTGGAATGVVNHFTTNTRAHVLGGDLQAGALQVAAASDNAASLVGGAGALGGIAVSGTALVNMGSSTTLAQVGEAGRSTAIDVSREVDVLARSRSDFNGVAISGAGGGGAGIAGMAQVHLLENDTRALVSHASIDATDIHVKAQDILELSAFSGALGVGIAGGGFGAGASVAILGSSVRADVEDSRLVAGNHVEVEAHSDRDVDMVTLTGGVGASVGIGGAASLLLAGVGGIGDSASELGGTFASLKQLGSGQKVDAAALEGTLGGQGAATLNDRAQLDIGNLAGRGDLVRASITRGSVQARDLDVVAETLMRSQQTVGGVGVGGLGLGGAFGMTGLYGSTQALLSADSVRAGSVDVHARAGDGLAGLAAGLDVYAGGAGLVGLGAAIGTARLEQSVTAAVVGDLQAGNQGQSLDVQASDASTLDVNATGMAAGALAAGAVVATAVRDTDVQAWLADNSTLTGFGNVTFRATSTGGAHAQSLGAAGGVLAGMSAAVALADDSSDVQAWLGERSRISGVGGGVQVHAEATPDVSARSVGAVVAGGLAVGAAVAEATSNATVGAQLGRGVVLSNRGALDVLASVDGGSVAAHATAGAGGLYLAGAGAFATAASHNTVVAALQDDVVVQGEAFVRDGVTDYARAGAVDVHAVNNSAQRAEATGLSAAGLLAAGVVKADTASAATTGMTLGEGAVLYAGITRLSTTGRDDNLATATAGTGGVLAGNAAVATTRATSNTRLAIGRDAVLDVDRLDAHVVHDSRYGGRADSTSAGVLNASGATVGNIAAADVVLEIGRDAQIVTGGDLTLHTDNNYANLLDGELAASAAGGGVLTGSASEVTAQLDGSSSIDIGQGALLRSGVAPGNGDAGVLDMVASTRASTDDRAGLTTGGAINVAVVKARTDARFVNRVDIGEDARLQSNAMLNVGTYAATDIGATALVNTWGVLAAVGISDADVDLHVDQQVNVASGAKLESLHNAFVSAGQDGMNGWTSRLGANAVSHGYSRGLIAVPDSAASSTVDSRAHTALASGSELLSGAFVSLGAYGENVFRNADGAATGYQIGFIPVTERDSVSRGATEGNVLIDGRVVAGRYNVLDIDIDSDGVLTSRGGPGGDVLPFHTGRELSSALQARLNAAGIHDFDAVAGSAQHTRTIGDLYAAGGDVILYGRNISGSGSVTAQGAPRITITNRSTDNLLLAGDILVPDYSGGNVLFTGNSNQAGGVGVHQNPGQSNALVSVRNEAGSGKGAIAAGGLISVTGGTLDMYNALGNIQSWGEQLAESVTINAPEGEVGYNLGSANWYGNLVSSLWAQHSLASRITNPDDAAAYIANAQYGAAAASAGMSLTDYLLYGTGNSSSNRSILVYGACRYRVGDKDCTASALGGQYHDGGVVSRYSHKNTNYLPTVNSRNLRNRLTLQPDDVTNASLGRVPSTGSGVNAGSGIKITANHIDVNVALKAGRPVDYSAVLVESQALRLWIQGKDAMAGKGLFDVPAEFIAAGAGSTRIALKYDSLNRQFIVPDISANGGGSIYLDGRMVSTSTVGSLNVVSGKGSVVIDNGLADVGLQLGDILVGNGAPGQITIRDRERGIASWYLRDSSGQVRGYQSGNVDAADWKTPGVTALQDVGGYDPRAGMYARWTQNARIARNIHVAANGVATAENWRWVDSNGNTLYNGQQWSSSGVSYGHQADGVPLFESQLTGRFSNYYDSGVHYGCESKNPRDCNYGFPANDQFNENGSWRTLWYQSAPRSGTLTVTNTAKADNRIGINFSANDAGLLDVGSGQTIRINGVLKNTDGRTLLTSRHGSIVNGSSDARIVTNQLTLDAAGSIGSIVGAPIGGASNPLAVQMVPYTDANGGTVAAGNLVARAGGDVALDVDSAAKVLINAGTGSTRGDVWLRAKYDIDGAASGRSASITGADITLHSVYGGIGALSRPLVIDAGERVRSDGLLEGGQVWARATGDIALSDIGGDFWVRRVESLAGDVMLEAPAGSIYSGAQRGASDFLTESQLASLRDNLKLFQGGGAQSILSYQSQVDAGYAEYFQLKALGNVVDGHFVAGSRAIELFRSMAQAERGSALDDTGVADYLAERFERLGTVFTDAFGKDWQHESMFAAFDAQYRYDLADSSADSVLVAARKAALREGMTAESQWTQAQLRNVFNANALEPSTGSALDAEPVISGRDVTLRARDDLGRLDKDYIVSLEDLASGNLDADTMLAMRLATTPGDVQMLDGAGNVLTAEQVRNDAVVDSLRVRSTAPVVLAATGEVEAEAGSDAYVHGSTSLALRSFTAGGDARIGSDGDITDAAGSGVGATLVVGRDLSLSALRSLMGHDGQPLRVQINGRLLLANAGEHVRLAQQSGDLRIGIVNANRDVVLDVEGGSLLSYLKGVAALAGRDIVLSVRDDIRDADGSALALRIVAGGQLDGSAGGSVRLSSDFDLPLGTLTTGGDLQLLSSAGSVRAAQLRAGRDLQVTGYSGVALDRAEAGRSATVSAPVGDIRIDDLRAASATLNAGGALQLGDAAIDDVLRILSIQGTSLAAGAAVHAGDRVEVDAAGFDMGTGSRLSAGRVVDVRSTSDIRLGQLAVTGNAPDNTVMLHADGRIESNGDVAVNVSGGSYVHASLEAGTGIGDPTQALSVDVGQLVMARSVQGDIHLQLPNGGDVREVHALAGKVALDSGAHLQAHRVQAGTDVRVRARSADIETVLAGGALQVDADGALTVGDLRSGGNASLSSGEQLRVDTGAVGADATLTSAGDMAIGSLQSGGTLAATSGAALAAQALTSGGAMRLDAREALDVQTLASAGDLEAVAGGRLALVDTAVAGDARIDGAADVQLDTLRVDRTLVANAGGLLALGSGAVGADAMLTSAGDMAIGSLQSGGTLAATSGAALAAQALTSGGAMRLDAREALDVQTLASAGDLEAVAGGRLALVDTAVAGDARIDGAADVQLDTLRVDSTLVANAGGLLALDSGAVGADATLTSAGAMAIGSLQSGGTLAATSGAALAAQALTSGGAMRLDARESLDVQTLASAGDLEAVAGGRLALVDTAVAGDARIDGAADVQLDTLRVDRTLVANAGGLLALGSGAVGVDATLTSAGAMAIGSLQSGGTLAATSGAALAAQALTSGGAMRLDAREALDVQTLASAGDLEAVAGGRLALVDTAVAGDARIDGAADVQLDTLRVDRTLVANAGGLLALGSGAVGADATLTSAGDMAIGSLQSGGTLAATSGAALAAQALTSGGAMRLDAREALDVQTLASAGDLEAVAGGRLALVDTAVAGDARIDGAADVQLDTLRVDRTLVANAGGLLALDSGAVGADATLTSAGDMAIGSLQSGGTLAATSGAALAAQALTSGGAMRLDAREALDVQTLASAGDLEAVAGGRLALVDTAVAGDARIDGAADVQLETLRVDRTLVANAGGLLALGTGAVGADAMLTSAGDMAIGSLQSGGTLAATSGAALAAQALTSGGAMRLDAREALDVQTLASAGDLEAVAGGRLALVDTAVDGDARIDGAADVQLETLRVDRTLVANAGGLLALGSGAVGADATLTSAGDMAIGSLQSGGTLAATSGAALAAQALTSGGAMRLDAREALDVQTLASAGDLEAVAGGRLALVDTAVAGDARIDGAADVQLDTLRVDRTLVANAGGLLALGSGAVGADAMLTSAGDMAIGSLQSGGTLAATSGAALAAQALTSGGAMRLDAREALDVQTLASAGDLEAVAGGRLALVDTAVAGDARIDGAADVQLDTLRVDRTLVANAGGLLALGTGAVGADATLTSAGDMAIGSLQSGGTLAATSGAALAAQALTSGGAMRLDAREALDVQTLASAGDLEAVAGGRLALVDTAVDGDARIDGAADVQLDTLRVDRTLVANAGGLLALGTGAVGADAMLTSAGDMAIGSLQSGGTLAATSGAALAAQALTSGGAMRLDAREALDVQTLASAGDLEAVAGGRLALVDTAVDGDARIDGAADVQLDTLRVDRTLVANAGGLLALGSGAVGADATLTSAGDTRIGVLEGGANLSANAGADIRVAHVGVDGSMALNAGRSIDVGSARIGTDGLWTAAADIDADDVTVGCNFSGNAGASVTIGTLQAGCNLAIGSGSSLLFERLRAERDVAVAARGADVGGGDIDAGTALQIDAARDIRIGSARAGTTLRADSGAAQSWNRYQAGTAARLHAGADVGVGEGQSGAAQSILAGGSIAFDRVDAGTTATMDAQGGALTGGRLQAQSGNLAARDTLSLASAIVDTRLNLSANDVQAQVLQSLDGGGALTTTLTGYRNGAARRLVVDVQPRDAWLIDSLRAMDAQLTGSTDQVTIEHGYVGRTMRLTTPTMGVLMDNTSPVLRPADVQLLQLDGRFTLTADGSVLATNAFVVRFSDGFRVLSTNYNRDHSDGSLDYLGESALRYMGRMLQLPEREDVTPVIAPTDADEAAADVVTSVAGDVAINLGTTY